MPAGVFGVTCASSQEARNLAHCVSDVFVWLAIGVSGLCPARQDWLKPLYNHGWSQRCHRRYRWGHSGAWKLAARRNSIEVLV